jgi:UDP-N-acetylglucosamine 2-epimerase (non-hydrolysing)
MKKILIVFGTRPEAIKMAPLVSKFKNYPTHFETIVCVTGQHREMLDQVLKLFEITPDFDLNIMKDGQDLYDITARILIGMRDILSKSKPDLVIVHGDTTTSIAAALAAFYNQIQVAHVEAGLRTNNIYSPWPEEMNRLLTSKIATFHFAPTSFSKDNLINEGIRKDSIFVTGNTVIDSLKAMIHKINANEKIKEDVKKTILCNGYDANRLLNSKKLILITGHRRENFGDGFINICQAIKTLAERFVDVDFVYPMHMNPNVRNPINEVFNGCFSKNLFFVEPLEYLPFVYLLSNSTVVLTDSGGIQEEAPGFGKPVLVMRDTTERPEAIEAGTVKLVGTSYDRIVQEVSILLNDSKCYENMSNAQNPFGDGNASSRIVDIIYNIL